MTERIDIAGLRFGRLLAQTYIGNRRWRCLCDCGAAVDALGSHLRLGRAYSCGCAHRRPPPANKTHGMSRTPIYRAWESMIKRCQTPSDTSYANYGGRGIRVCDSWQTFDGFFADMGPRPSPKHSVERNDTNGHYEPGNCRWATRTEQQRNMRSNRLITHNGRTQCLAAWADGAPVSAQLLRSRIEMGWTFADAIRLPSGSRRPTDSTGNVTVDRDALPHRGGK